GRGRASWRLSSRQRTSRFCAQRELRCAGGCTPSAAAACASRAACVLRRWPTRTAGGPRARRRGVGESRLHLVHHDFAANRVLHVVVDEATKSAALLFSFALNGERQFVRPEHAATLVPHEDASRAQQFLRHVVTPLPACSLRSM